jgi:hypothetical protein
MAEPAGLLSVLGEQGADRRVPSGDVIEIGLQGYAVHIEVREGMVPQLHSGIQPGAQEGDPPGFYPLPALQLPAVHEPYSGDSLGLERCYELLRDPSP